MGRYILTPEIFMFLGDKKRGRGRNPANRCDSEIKRNSRVYAYEFEGKDMM